jgi:hypothetical protein
MMLLGNFLSVRLGLIGLSFVMVTALLRAELVWETTEHRIPVDLGQEAMQVEFPFSNTGDETVVILDIKHSCGCTMGDLEKDTYEPGESGSLVVTIDLRNMSGELVKEVKVTSRAGETTEDLLWLYADVPVPFKLSPAILSWKAYGDVVPRRLKLQLHQDLVYDRDSIEILIDDRDGTGVAFEDPVLAEGPEGVLLIDVTPARLGKQGHNYLQVYLDTNDGRQLAGEAYLLIL